MISYDMVTTMSLSVISRLCFRVDKIRWEDVAGAKKSSSNVSAPVSLTMTSLVKAHGLQIELDKCIM